MTKGTLLAVAALALVVGCGGGRDDAGAIRVALARSPGTYLHYDGRVWWGRPVDVSVARIRPPRDGFAVALLEVRWAGRVHERQWVLLRERAGRWRVLGGAARATMLGCGLAPAGVVSGLVGGCMLQRVDTEGLVRGPADARPATVAERAGLVATARHAIFDGRDACVRYTFGISRVDEGWASGAYEFRPPYRSCQVGNGVSIFHRLGSRWRHVADASSGFACSTAPPGVVRSLFGTCSLG